MDETASWLTIPAAARLLGVTPQAIRKRLKRGTLNSRRNNRGQELVLVPGAPVRTPEPEPEPPEPWIRDPTSEARQTPQDAGEMIPAAIHREMIAVIQAAHSATVAELQGQVDQLRSDRIEERRRHEGEIERYRRDMALERTETARQCAEHDILHRTTLADQRRIIDRLLPRNDPPALLPRARWWPDWFGRSSRSRVRGR